MKLYLASSRLKEVDKEFQKWVHSLKDPVICLITNSLDAFSNDKRKAKGIMRDLKDLEKIGFRAVPLNLRDYFGRQEQLENLFSYVTGFCACGGNTFVLRQAMMLSGFDEILIQYLSNSQFLYMGYSAGSCVVSKDLHGVAQMDEPQASPYWNCISPIYRGLGLIEEAIIPHFKSDHSESSLADEAVAYCITNGLLYLPLKDGEYLYEDLEKRRTKKL